jgi:hypothetical protein
VVVAGRFSIMQRKDAVVTGAPADPFDVELRRVVDRLRRCSVEALAGPVGRWPSRADAAYAVAQALADAAATVAGEPRRLLPRLGDSVVADQLAVCGADLLAVAVDDVPDDVLALVVELRRAL